MPAAMIGTSSGNGKPVPVRISTRMIPKYEM